MLCVVGDVDNHRDKDECVCNHNAYPITNFNTLALILDKAHAHNRENSISQKTYDALKDNGYELIPGRNLFVVCDAECEVDNHRNRADNKHDKRHKPQGLFAAGYSLLVFVVSFEHKVYLLKIIPYFCATSRYYLMLTSFFKNVKYRLKIIGYRRGKSHYLFGFRVSQHKFIGV